MATTTDTTGPCDTTDTRDGLDAVLTLSELAARLRVSVQTIYDLRSQGRGPRGFDGNEKPDLRLLCGVPTAGIGSDGPRRGGDDDHEYGDDQAVDPEGADDGAEVTGAADSAEVAADLSHELVASHIGQVQLGPRSRRRGPSVGPFGDDVIEAHGFSAESTFARYDHGASVEVGATKGVA